MGRWNTLKFVYLLLGFSKHGLNRLSTCTMKYYRFRSRQIIGPSPFFTSVVCSTSIEVKYRVSLNEKKSKRKTNYILSTSTLEFPFGCLGTHHHLLQNKWPQVYKFCTTPYPPSDHPHERGALLCRQGTELLGWAPGAECRSFAVDREPELGLYPATRQGDPVDV